MNISCDLFSRLNRKWNGTSLQLGKATNEEFSELKSFFPDDFDGSKKLSYNEEEQIIEIFNASEILLYELEFIKENPFKHILNKFKDKINEEFFYFYNEQDTIFERISFLRFCNKEEFEQILSKNKFDVGFENELLNIPPELFSIFDGKCFTEEEKKIVTYLKNLFSLLLISEYTNYKNGTFLFSIMLENGDFTSIQVKWKEWDSLESLNFFIAYEWIVKETDNAIKIGTKLKVVREALRREGSFSIGQDAVNRFNSMLNVIIKNQTDKYFEQQNKLKNDFLDLNKKELDSKRQLFTKLLAVIATIGATFYGVFKPEYIVKFGDMSLLSKNPIIGMVCLVAIVSIIFFSITFILDIIERRKIYNKLKRWYVNNFGFSVEEFTSSVDKPYFLKNNWIQWFLIILFIILLIVGIFHYGIPLKF